MKRKYLLYACICSMVFVLLLPCGSLSDGSAAVFRIAPEEWKWDPGSVNSFSGECDLSAFSGVSLSIRLSSDLPATDPDSSESVLSFTSLNGHRIAVLEQSDTLEYTPGGEESGPETVTFSGQIHLPKKPRVRDINFTLQVLDQAGNEMAVQAYRVSYRDGGSERTKGAFYISADIGSITLICALCAACVWMIALARYIYIRKRT